MTRPDKHAARFGDRDRPPLNSYDDDGDYPLASHQMRVVPHVADMAAPTLAELQAGRELTGLVGFTSSGPAEHAPPPGPMLRFRRVDPNPEPAAAFLAGGYVVQPTEYHPVDPDDPDSPHDWQIGDPVTVFSFARQPDILDRIDSTLDSYDTRDMQGREFAPSGEPWPYEERF